MWRRSPGSGPAAPPRSHRTSVGRKRLIRKVRHFEAKRGTVYTLKGKGVCSNEGTEPGTSSLQCVLQRGVPGLIRGIIQLQQIIYLKWVF